MAGAGLERGLIPAQPGPAIAGLVLAFMPRPRSAPTPFCTTHRWPVLAWNAASYPPPNARRGDRRAGAGLHAQAQVLADTVADDPQVAGAGLERGLVSAAGQRGDRRAGARPSCPGPGPGRPRCWTTHSVAGVGLERGLVSAAGQGGDRRAGAGLHAQAQVLPDPVLDHPQRGRCWPGTRPRIRRRAAR